MIAAGGASSPLRGNVHEHLSSPACRHPFRAGRTRRPRPDRAASRLRGGRSRRRDGRPGGGREIRRHRPVPAQCGRRSRGVEAPRRRHGADAARFQGRLSAILRKRLERPHQVDRIRRAGAADPGRHRGGGNVARVESRVQPVRDADAGRDRSAGARGFDGAQGEIPAEHGRRHVERHDEPDGAAGGFRSRGRAHEGRPPGRRHVQAAGPEDLHHLRRAGLHRKHHPSRPRTDAGCAGRRQGHFAVRRAEGNGGCGRLARRSQRRRLRIARA